MVSVGIEDECVSIVFIFMEIEMEDVVCDCGECLMCWLEEQGVHSGVPSVGQQVMA